MFHAMIAVGLYRVMCEKLRISCLEPSAGTIWLDLHEVQQYI